MTWVAAGVAAGGAVLGGVMGNRGASKAAKAQEKASQAAIAEQRLQYAQAREDMSPWMAFGREQLPRMNALLSGDYSSFMQSPDYLAARDMGLQSLDRSAAKRGGLFSGGADADRIKFAGELATQNLNNHWNRLSGAAGMGQAAAGSLGSLGANAANQNSHNNMLAGAGRASAYQQQGQNYMDMAQSIGGAFNKGWQGWKAAQGPSGGANAGLLGGFGNNMDNFETGYSGWGGNFGNNMDNFQYTNMLGGQRWGNWGNP